MSTVKVKISIDAPVERVWETVMDPHRLGDWVTIHKSVSNVSGHQIRQGSTMDQVLQLRGVPFHVHWTLQEVNPPNLAKWDGRGPAHSRAVIQYRLTETGEDATLFEYTNEFTPPGGRLGIVASRVIMGAASEREAHGSLQRLKALLEHGD